MTYLMTMPMTMNGGAADFYYTAAAVARVCDLELYATNGSFLLHRCSRS